MISISLSDLQLITELSRMTELEMINPINDELMMKHLHFIGMDVPDYAFCYLPNVHRNLQDKVVLGFRVIGETRCDHAFRNGPIASLTDKLVISSYFDSSLTEALGELTAKARDYESFNLDLMEEQVDKYAAWPDDQTEPDWKEVEAQIILLEELRDELRGPMYTASGALKMPHEYQEWVDTRSLYEEKYGS